MRKKPIKETSTTLCINLAGVLLFRGNYMFMVYSQVEPEANLVCP